MGHNVPMLKREDIIGLRPTRVEEPLVSAIRKYGHAGWPYIYLALRDVTKDDLLADPEYCSRHRHPSMTQYLEECALFGEQGGITMLRKYQRAGSLYEEVQKVSDGKLPAITDLSVCTVSPDAFILVARVARILDSAGSQARAHADELLVLLVSKLIEGRGLSRQQMLRWISLLGDAERDGSLEGCAEDFLAQVRKEVHLERGEERYGRLNSELCFVAGSQLSTTATVRSQLDDPSWLACLMEDGEQPSGRIEMIDLPRIRNVALRDLGADFAVVESVTGDLVVHLVDVSPGEGGRAASERRPEDLVDSGVDYVWVVLDSGRTWAGSDEPAASSGIGVFNLDGEKLSVAAPARKLSPPASARVRILELLLAESLCRTARKKKALNRVPSILMV